MISVTAAVLRDGDLILIAKRGSGKHLEGYWEFPGGKIEEGETPSVCLERELNEEFGIGVQVGSYITSNVHDYGDKKVNLMAYEVLHLSGEFQLIDHDEIRWVSKSELMSVKLAPADVTIAKTLISRF